MIILHIASISNTGFSGVAVAVPKHIISQQKNADVAFINIKNEQIPGVKKQFLYRKNFALESLPSPYNNPDLVVFHEIYIPAFLQISRSLTKKNIPYIIIPHGGLSDIAQRQKWLKKRIANLLLFNKYIYGAKSVQYLSASEQIRSIFKTSSFIGTNGVAVPREKKDGNIANELTFLFIGRYDIHIKGLDLLLSAVKAKQNLLRDRKVKLKLFGVDVNGSHKILAETISRYGISDVVELNSTVTGEEKMKELLAADMFIQTSRTEGMPMGILEALGYGLPCLVTKGTGVSSVIDESGSGYVCDTNERSIAETIESVVLKPEKLRNMSYNARILIENKFDENIVAAENINNYKQLLGL